MIMVLAKAIPNDESAKEKVIEFAQDLIAKSKAEDGNVDYNLSENTGAGPYKQNISLILVLTLMDYLLMNLK